MRFWQFLVNSSIILILGIRCGYGARIDIGVKVDSPHTLATPFNITTQKGGNRIAGGQDVRPYSIPWQVYINIENDWEGSICGGAILTRYYVLTAGHCMFFRVLDEETGYFEIGQLAEPQEVKLVVGKHFSEKASSCEKVHKVEEIILHPSGHIHTKWTIEEQWKHLDLALVKLKADDGIDFAKQKFARPICLPSPVDVGKFSANQEFLMTGWGIKREQGHVELPKVLQMARLPWVRRDVCKPFFPDYDDAIVDERHLCAGKRGLNACHGDSGGALAWQSGGKGQDGTRARCKVVGILSMSFSPCEETSIPGVYAKVASKTAWNWIESVIDTKELAENQQMCAKTCDPANHVQVKC